MNAIVLLPDPDESERHRRALLRQSDTLLTIIEELRLARVRVVPDDVRSQIRSLQIKLGRVEPAPVRLSVRGAQELLFGLQQRLMAANPRRPSARAHPGRAGGAPVVRPIRPGIRWKLIVLPPSPGAGREDRWLELIAATVERALDRWAYAQHHALRTVRSGQPAAGVLALARVAWNNYWDLREEALRIRRTLGSATSAATSAPASPAFAGPVTAVDRRR